MSSIGAEGLTCPALTTLTIMVPHFEGVVYVREYVQAWMALLLLSHPAMQIAACERHED